MSSLTSEKKLSHYNGITKLTVTRDYQSWKQSVERYLKGHASKWLWAATNNWFHDIKSTMSIARKAKMNELDEEAKEDHDNQAYLEISRFFGRFIAPKVQ